MWEMSPPDFGADGWVATGVGGLVARSGAEAGQKGCQEALDPVLGRFVLPRYATTRHKMAATSPGRPPHGNYKAPQGMMSPPQAMPILQGPPGDPHWQYLAATRHTEAATSPEERVTGSHQAHKAQAGGQKQKLGGATFYQQPTRGTGWPPPAPRPSPQAITSRHSNWCPFVVLRSRDARAAAGFGGPICCAPVGRC